ncbi:pantoate--beta-alanine ligase [Thalassobacillus sp. CUG 92003]|uniref:pantoate--beta-alanine ligase n=1 Tax=Thalassobacillus sp. CUG 92003 TaxID=2736641 RepID=UPI0015E77EB1|nr:pantoate--beta-alanine ligase [Thalassobacillus sp. CUG 92003]
MRVISSVTEMQSISMNLKRSDHSVGFVPTMGYLHEGHEQLLDAARANHDVVILSIFVNPLQFGAGEDLDHYPRDEARDRQIAKAHGVDYVFLPSERTMYPTPPILDIQVVRRTDALCGKSRPGHFAGVVTVLAKLFNICQPDGAYFGMKDAQQVAVVTGFVEDLNFPIEIVAVETVREADGLAKSSRNANLTKQERLEAPAIQQALKIGRDAFMNGETSVEAIKQKVKTFIEGETHGKIDYVELRSYPELEEIALIEDHVILAVAVQFKKARLIDNVVFDHTGTVVKG